MGGIINHDRKSLRLKGYDYSQPGAYFVTTVTLEHKPLFGHFESGRLYLNEYGRIVVDAWQGLARAYSYVELDACVVMPNHVHGILVIVEPPRPDEKIKPLGQLMGAFKTASANRINQLRGTPGTPIWQRGFWDHIIRNDHEWDDIRAYIEDNPLQSQEDH